MECLLPGASLTGHRYCRHCRTAVYDTRTFLFIYASNVAGFFTRMGEHPTSDEVDFYLGRQASSRNHSRFSDLMDTISGMREDYRLAWEAEYTS